MLRNHVPTIVVAVAMMAASVFPVQSALATTAAGSATIDWSGLVFDFGAGAGSPFTEVSTVTFIESPGVGVSDSDGNPDAVTLTSSSAHVVFPGLFDFDLVASGSASALNASFSLVSGLPGSAFDGTSSTAFANRSITFVAVGAGVLTVRVPYTLSASTDEFGVFSDSFVNLTLLRSRGAGSTFGAQAFASILADVTSEANLTDSGELMLALPFRNGDNFTLGMQTEIRGYAQLPAPVPLPPAIVLFSGGLLALLRRRLTA